MERKSKIGTRFFWSVLVLLQVIGIEGCFLPFGLSNFCVAQTKSDSSPTTNKVLADARMGVGDLNTTSNQGGSIESQIARDRTPVQLEKIHNFPESSSEIIAKPSLSRLQEKLTLTHILYATVFTAYFFQVEQILGSISTSTLTSTSTLSSSSSSGSDPTPNPQPTQGEAEWQLSAIRAKSFPESQNALFNSWEPELYAQKNYIFAFMKAWAKAIRHDLNSRSQSIFLRLSQQKGYLSEGYPFWQSLHGSGDPSQKTDDFSVRSDGSSSVNFGSSWKKLLVEILSSEQEEDTEKRLNQIWEFLLENKNDSTYREFAYLLGEALSQRSSQTKGLLYLSKIGETQPLRIQRERDFVKEFFETAPQTANREEVAQGESRSNKLNSDLVTVKKVSSLRFKSKKVFTYWPIYSQLPIWKNYEPLLANLLIFDFNSKLSWQALNYTSPRIQSQAQAEEAILLHLKKISAQYNACSSQSRASFASFLNPAELRACMVYYISKHARCSVASSKTVENC